MLDVFPSLFSREICIISLNPLLQYCKKHRNAKNHSPSLDNHLTVLYNVIVKGVISLSKGMHFKRKILSVVGVISFVLLLSLAMIFIVGGIGVQGSGIKAFLSNCMSAGVHWVVLIFLAGLVGIFLIIAIITIVLPLVLFFLGKLWTLITLRAICAKNKFSYKVKGSIFASRNESNKHANIEIKMKDKTLHVHFVDIPLSLMNVVVFANDREYRIFSTTRGKVAKLGGGAAVNMTAQRAAVFQETQRNISENYKSQEIPEFAPKNPHFHIFVIDPGFVRVKYMRGNELVDISAEVSVGNIIVCKTQTLKKRLKGELYPPLE